MPVQISFRKRVQERGSVPLHSLALFKRKKLELRLGMESVGDWRNKPKRDGRELRAEKEAPENELKLLCRSTRGKLSRGQKFSVMRKIIIRGKAYLVDLFCQLGERMARKESQTTGPYRLCA